MVTAPALPYVAYEASRRLPNIVVDGAANEATVLCLSHWPGTAQPPGLADDLSAQMAFRYLEQGSEHSPAQCVTNNHYDQDGLVSVHALARPDESVKFRDLLIDIAAAGDFGTYRHRSSARASMIISAYADPQRSPIADQLKGRSYGDQCELLYEETVPLLVSMATSPERFKELWDDEDDRLTTTERSLESGRIQIVEHPEVDLAIVTIGEGASSGGGHRFAGKSIDEVHPFAVHNATDRFRILIISGRWYRYVDRYETWVQYQSRPIMQRVDLGVLADRLSDMEDGSVIWQADDPSEIMPTMSPGGESSIGPAAVVDALIDHLSTAPPVWDPTRSR